MALEIRHPPTVLVLSANERLAPVLASRQIDALDPMVQAGLRERDGGAQSVARQRL